jgi:PAS domain S-box-containing protein
VTLSLVFFSAISGAALLCYAALLLITVRNGLRLRSHRFFALYLGSMIVWSAGALMMYLAPEKATSWNQVMMMGVAVSPLAFYGFVLGYLGRSPRNPYLTVGVVVLLVSLIQNAFGRLVVDVSVASTGMIAFGFGPAMPLFGAYYLFFQFMAGYYLTHDYRHTTDFSLRNRIKYILVGWILMITGALSNILPIAGTLPVDIAANLVNAVLISYAISRYHLLDLSLIVRKGLVYTLSTGLVVIGYLLIVFLGIDLLALMGGARLMLALIVALLVAFLLLPGYEQIQARIDQLFFRQKYDTAVMLQRLSRQVASMLDLQQLAELILDEISQTMQINRVMLLIRDRETRHFEPLAERGFGQAEALQFKVDSPITIWLSAGNDRLTANDLALQPHFKGLWASERADLAAAQIELFIGSRSGDELVAMLALGPKRSGAAYTPDEQRTLETLANQTAVAVQNARLYGAALEEKERAETILQAAFAGMIVVDRELRIVAMNSSAELLTGHPLEELRSMPLSAALGSELANQCCTLAALAQSGPRPAPFEGVIDTAGQRLDLLLGVTPLHDGCLVNFADITRQKEVERLKSDIVAEVSHELRSPLASIKGYAELLLEDLDEEDRAVQRRFLSVINDEADRLATFINDMLDLTRLESGSIHLDLTPTPIDSLTIDAARSLKVQADAAGVSVQTQITGELPLILVDSRWLYGAIKNLIHNAIKFSPRGATVEVIVGRDGLSGTIDVIDHGPGIAPQDIPRLFTKFYRGSTARQLGISGSGLGLALARQAVELHQGTLTLNENSKPGAHFTVKLPIVQAGAAEHPGG